MSDVETGVVKETAIAAAQPLDKYEVEKKIGQGQFSTVYQAKRKSDNMVVALKRVPVRRLCPLHAV
jgi:serine/threonine protein kinase